MKKTALFFFTLFLVNLPLAVSAQALPGKKAASSKFRGVAVELYGGASGCMGDWCEGSSPSIGGAGALHVRLSKHWSWGLMAMYNTLSNDDFDGVHYYNISVEGRANLPLGPVNLYLGVGIGYLTYYMEGSKTEAYDFEHLRGTAPTLNAEAGVDFRLFKGLSIGLAGRYIFPIWSEVCLSSTGEKECIGPQDDRVKMDLTSFWAGVRITYHFPH